MKVIIVIIFSLFFTIIAFSQPMNGSYTVGGTSPDFITLQEAADSLISRGISGPVFVNIRPGTYIENNGIDPIMDLVGIVVGVSPDNRITLQPDISQGGSVENVILQIDQTTQSSTAIIRITVDYVTVRNLTFEDIDSAEAGANVLVGVGRFFPSNLTVEGTIIEGCRFLGNASPVGGTTFGTDYGIQTDISITDIIIRNNLFQRLMRSVDVGAVGTGSGNGDVFVEDNQVLAAHFGTSGTGSFLGHGISVDARDVAVRRNLLDNAGGRGSIFGIIIQADTGLVERNMVMNGGSVGPGSAQNGSYRGITVDGITAAQPKSMRVVNNMISGATSGGLRTGIEARCRSEIIHNTVVHPERQQRSRGIVFDLGNADSSKVINNILIDFAIPIVGIVNPIVLFDQTDGMNGLISDYNIFFLKHPGAFLIARGATEYAILSDYQAATSLDSHTIVKNIDFIGGNDDLHLSECQAQDSELAGIPFPGIVDDIDGDVRSITAPFRGADEGNLRANPMFGDLFTIPLSGTAFTLAAGQLDNIAGDEIVVPDHDNRKIHLYHSVSGTRSFSHSLSVDVDFPPSVVRIYDINDDNHQDILVGGDTTLLWAYWGDGTGHYTYLNSSYAPTAGRVVSIEPFGTKSVAITEADGLVPNESFFGVVQYTTDPLFPGLPILCHTALIRDEGLFTVTDTIPSVMYDFAVGNFDADPGAEAVAIAIGPSVMELVSFENFVFRVEIGGGVCGDRYSADYSIAARNVGSFVGHTSSIVPGDFDADGDIDFIMTGSVSTLIPFMKNDGNFSLTEELVPTLPALGVVKMDYDNDGDLDFVTTNRQLEDNGVSVFLNDGTGHFTEEINCFARFGSGVPFGAVASDFDQDGKTDIAIASSFDTVFVLYNFGALPTAVETPSQQEIPVAFSLGQNYPNPFNPLTYVDFELPSAGYTSLKVYDLLGREVAVVVDGFLAAGRKSVSWNAADVSSGVYYYKLQAGSFVEVKKMVVMK
jgi:hypothetical protein